MLDKTNCVISLGYIGLPTERTRPDPQTSIVTISIESDPLIPLIPRR